MAGFELRRWGSAKKIPCAIVGDQSDSLAGGAESTPTDFFLDVFGAGDGGLVVGLQKISTRLVGGAGGHLYRADYAHVRKTSLDRRGLPSLCRRSARRRTRAFALDTA